MSLKTKIILSFVISVIIITTLTIFEYGNFIEIRKEIRHIEITDMIRSKSLQLRRHEKNYFLNYSNAKQESGAVRTYLHQLNSVIDEGFSPDAALMHDLRSRIQEYEQRFNMIESSARDLSKEFEEIKTYHERSREYFPLIEAILIEHPIQGAELLEKLFSLPPDKQLISGMKELDEHISALRRNGEDIIVISEELDKHARERMEKTIQISQIAIFVFSPLFFITGIGTIFFFNRDVVNRLKALIEVVEKTGKGSFSKVAVAPGKWRGKDEVGTLIEKFNEMEEQLAQRERELEEKNKELFQSKKLAAIGTLASGVAHELNNPLNNIYISTQVLVREMGDAYPTKIKEVITDIHSQTLRVKRIVGDLLEFARGRDPKFEEVDLCYLIREAYQLAGSTATMEGIKFSLDSDRDKEIVRADAEQIERVFINLFVNAAEAMSGDGNLSVKILQHDDDSVTITVSDSGRGISGEALEKIFEPFYTTKDKGTGLGLAIVFNIINKHKGNIRIQSEEGKGTTFTITLPKGLG